MTKTTNVNNDTCPVCLTDKYLNQSLKLLVSPCFHKMCETCVDRLFRSGPGPCPICKTTLRKSNFTTQKFDDLYVEKEVQIRKKLSFINKRQEDFGSLREYNDYLEETEEIIFNMINNVDIQETNERIERFRNENKELIERNKQKQLQEERLIQQKIQREKLEKQARKEAFLEIENKQLNEKQQSDLELITKIQSSSSKDLKTVLKENKYKKQKVDKVEIKIELEEIEEDDDFDFEPVDTVLNRISFVNTNQYSSRLTTDIKGDVYKASGFSTSITFTRALTSATSALFANI